MFASDTVVSTIDTNDVWFQDALAEREPLPGTNRVDDEINVLTRPQIGVVIRGLQRSEITRNLSLAEACDVARGRRFARLRGRQMDFNMVDYFAAEEQEIDGDQPLTLGQERMIDLHVKALLGVEPHFRTEVQTAIDKLSPAQKERFIDDFEACVTRNDLNSVMKRYERRVPNPRLTTARSNAAEVVADLDIETKGEEAF